MKRVIKLLENKQPNDRLEADAMIKQIDNIISDCNKFKDKMDADRGFYQKDVDDIIELKDQLKETLDDILKENRT